MGTEWRKMEPEVGSEGHEELRIYPEGEKEARNF